MGFVLFLCFLVASFVRPGELFPELAPFRPMQILGWAAMAGTVYDFLQGHKPNLGVPQPYLAIAFVGWAMLSVLLQMSYLGGALYTFEVLGATLFLFALLVLNVDTLARLRTTGALLVMLGVYLTAQGVVAYHLGYRQDQFLFHQGTGIEVSEDTIDLGLAGDFEGQGRGGQLRIRALGVLNDPNDLAQVLVALLPIAFLYRRPGQALRNVVCCWLPIAILLYGVYLTRSRGGVLALLAVTFLALRSRLGRISSTILTVLIGVSIIAVGFVAGRASGIDESAEGRLEAWHEGLQMVKASPLWGVGFGNFLEGQERVAHNSLIHCAAEVGLVGFFLWLALIVVTVVDTAWVERFLDPDDDTHVEIGEWAEASRIALLGFLVAAYFLSRTYNVVLFLLVGLGSVVVALAQREDIPIPRIHVAAWVFRICVIEFLSLASIYLSVRLFS